MQTQAELEIIVLQSHVYIVEEVALQAAKNEFTERGRQTFALIAATASLSHFQGLQMHSPNYGIGMGRVDGSEGFSVPDRILVAFVAELTLYGFCQFDSRFPEFLRILEKRDVTGLSDLPGAPPSVGIGLAK
jgi:hypothetical protein